MRAPRRVTPLAAGAVVVVAGLVGCSGGSGQGSTGSEAPSTEAPTAPPTSTTGSAPGGSPSGSPTGTNSAENTFHGMIGGSGLTCIAFRADDGTSYALTGPGVTSKVRSIAHSRSRRDSLEDTPSAGKVAEVTVVGHVERHAMNTCSFRTLVASKIVVQSVSDATNEPLRRSA